MKKNYDELSNQIIEKVGGKDNISKLLHCYTRLRIQLKDTSIVDIEEIKKLNVLGAQYAGSQLQIIIGNDVNELYDTICKITGFTSLDAVDEKLDDKTKEKLTVKKAFTNVIDVVVGCFVPILPIVLAGGLLKSFVTFGQVLGLIAMDSPTAATLNFVSDAAFYFLPVYLGAFAAKKFGATISLGMLMGAMLLHPAFIQMVSSGNPGSVFGIPIYPAQYANSIIPVILSVWVMSYIEKFFSKYSPKTLRVILVPIFTMLVMIPLTLCAIAPLGFMLSNGVSTIILFLNDKIGFLTVGILAAIFPWLIMTGMHLGILPVSFQTLQTLGTDMLVIPAALISNIAQGAACLAVGVKTKNKDLKTFAYTASFSNIVPGVSEPGMYGITLKYKKPMITAMIGSLVGGIYIGFMKVALYTFGTPNLFTLPAFMKDGSTSFLHMCIGILITFVVTFLLTLIVYKKDDSINK